MRKGKGTSKPRDISAIDREVEALTARVTALSVHEARERDELRDRIAYLQRVRVEMSEPSAFRDAAASFG